MVSRNSSVPRRRRFTGLDYARDLASGNAVAVVGWSPSAFQLVADNPDLEWEMPEEGCILWWDSWVVPVGAPNPTAAYEWINYAYEPEHQAADGRLDGLGHPCHRRARSPEEDCAGDDQQPLVFPSEQYTENCSPTTPTPGDADAEQRIERAWSDATAG